MLDFRRKKIRALPDVASHCRDFRNASKSASSCLDSTASIPGGIGDIVPGWTSAMSARAILSQIVTPSYLPPRKRVLNVSLVWSLKNGLMPSRREQILWMRVSENQEIFNQRTSVNLEKTSTIPRIMMVLPKAMRNPSDYPRLAFRLKRVETPNLTGMRRCSTDPYSRGNLARAMKVLGSPQ